MHDDFHPYYVSKGTEAFTVTNYNSHPESWMSPMKNAPTSNVVEIPGMTFACFFENGRGRSVAN